MFDAPTFDELIRRVRAGDQDAAAELVRRYEPAIRRAVRFRLADARLGTLLDSMDICQSVLASFFVRAASGQYELETPETVAQAADGHGPEQADLPGAQAACPAPGRPPRHVRRRGRRAIRRRAGRARAGRWPLRDLLQEVRRRLSADERRLLELRNQGRDWAAIAARARRQRGGPAPEAGPGPRPGRRATGPGRRSHDRTDDARTVASAPATTAGPTPRPTGRCWPCC